MRNKANKFYGIPGPLGKMAFAGAVLKAGNLPSVTTTADLAGAAPYRLLTENGDTFLTEDGLIITAQ